MALLERLQILIDADAKGALREFDKAGAAADRLDSKLEKGSAKTAARLASIGSKTALGGVAIIGGLAALAKASDDAEIQQTKLQNSIKNSDNAFKDGGKGLTDLAQGLQKVTAADGDAITGAESLLVQFGLTEDQVKQITPLVVDLSRKMGIDLDQAAKIAGKAVGGNAGALKKLGINVDEATLKADGFGTTMKALAGSVGGFAREEGKTFSGQMAILKNNLGDLGESVGKGAASVLGGLAGDAANFVGALNKLNPAIGNSVGAIGAAGGVTATLAGGFAFAGGKAMQFVDSIKSGKSALVTLGEDGSRSLSKLGKATAVVGGVVAFTALTEAIFGIVNEANGMQERFSMAWDGIRKGAVGTSGDITKAFESLAKANDDALTWGHLITSWGDNIKLGKVNVEIEDAQKAFSDLLDTVGPEAAQKVIDGLKKQNSELDENSSQYKTNADFIAKNEKAVRERRDALKASVVAEREQKRATQDAVEALDRESATVDGVKQSIKDYNDKLSLLTSSYDAAQAGAKAFGDQIERSTSIDNIAGSVVKLADSVRTLNGDLTALPSFDVALDPTKISEGAGKAVDALIQYGDAAQTYFQQVIGAGGADLVPALAEKYRAILTTALQNAGVNPADIPNFIKLAGLDDESITVAVKFAKDQASLDRLKLELDLFTTELGNDPAATAFIKAAIAQGDFAGAQKFFEVWAASHPINVPVAPAAGTPGSYTVTVTPANSSGSTSGNRRDKSGRRVGAPAGEAPSPPSASLPPGRAVGGPVATGVDYKVNELGPEMFIPRSSGFVMNSGESRALVAGVQQLLTSGGGGGTINVYESANPRQTATEIVRKQRDAAYLIGR